MPAALATTWLPLHTSSLYCSPPAQQWPIPSLCARGQPPPLFETRLPPPSHEWPLWPEAEDAWSPPPPCQCNRRQRPPSPPPRRCCLHPAMAGRRHRRSSARAGRGTVFCRMPPAGASSRRCHYDHRATVCWCHHRATAFRHDIWTFSCGAAVHLPVNDVAGRRRRRIRCQATILGHHA